MGTKVQSKTYLTDLNNGFCNGTWDIYHDKGISGSGNSQYYDPFLMRQAVDGYAKEQMRQTILKQESIFRHQLQELHRLYKRQRDLMNEFARKQHCNYQMPTETSKSSHFQSQTPSEVSKETNFLISSLPKDFSLNSKCGLSQRSVIDLEQPADEDDKSKGKQQFSFADLNEPIQAEETSFSTSISKGFLPEKLQTLDSSASLNSGFWCLSNLSKENVMKKDERICSGDRFADGKTKFYNYAYPNGVFSHQANPFQSEQRKTFEHAEPQRKRTIFGVELCERNLTPSFDPSSQTPEPFAAKNHIGNINSRFIPSGMNSSNSVSDSLEKPRIMDGLTNHESRLPPWLTSIPTKGNETRLYQMNLDSLQNHSQQFFKKTEADKCHSITKILGVPIVDLPKNSDHVARNDHDHEPRVEHVPEGKDLGEKKGEKSCISDLRKEIDLNLSYSEEEGPESVEIDLEAAPPVLETETNSLKTKLDTPNLPSNDDSKDTQLDLDKVAAEAIMSISSSEFIATSQPPEEPPLLRWLAEVITSRGDISKDRIPEGMDYFEFMTLKLEETKEDYCKYKPVIVGEGKEEEGATFMKRRGGKRGRQRRDFQRDVLPGIVSLSRREVNEDIQTFEDAFTAVGVSWQSKRKASAAAKNGRGRRQVVVRASSPLPPPPLVVEEKSLGGWGKRTRRLPRRRCSTSGGGNLHSLALKC